MALPTSADIDAAIPVAGVPNRALTNAAIKSIIAEAVGSEDARLSDSRAPTGAAGGILTGEYPNPQFATPMATASDLASKIDISQKGIAGGLATLDSSGTVPLDQLNVSGLEFLGAWNASTNTPTLVDGTGNVGDFYKVSVPGTFNFGNGSYTFAVGDWVMFAGGTWQRIGVHESVSTVNSKTGMVVLTASDVGALPSTYKPNWADVQNKPALSSSGSGVPIGTPLMWLAAAPPAGYIWMDAYVAGVYPALDALFPQGMPNVTNRVFRHVGDLTPAVGQTQEDASQRITGYIDNVWTGGPSSQGGAFARAATPGTNARPATGTQANTRFNFDSGTSTGARVADETRVKSLIFRAIIKAYEPS